MLAAVAALLFASCGPRADVPRGDTGVATASVAVREPPRAPADSCLAGRQFALGGVALWGPDAALAALGAPAAVRGGIDEDDGGQVPIFTYDYPALQVDVVRGRIDRLRTSDSAVAGPLGLRVGMARDSAAARLTAAGALRFSAPDTIEVPHCDQESHLALALRGGRVASIEAAAWRP